MHFRSLGGPRWQAVKRESNTKERPKSSSPIRRSSFAMEGCWEGRGANNNNFIRKVFQKLSGICSSIKHTVSEWVAGLDQEEREREREWVTTGAANRTDVYFTGINYTRGLSLLLFLRSLWPVSTKFSIRHGTESWTSPVCRSTAAVGGSCSLMGLIGVGRITEEWTELLNRWWEGITTW